MENTGDYINSTPSSEVLVSIRISSSSLPLEAHQLCNFTISSRLEVLRVPKFFTFGSSSRLEASLYIFVTLGAIVHYKEIMEKYQLGSDNLVSILAPPENIPQDYVMVRYKSTNDDLDVQFALHHLVLLHLMGRVGRVGKLTGGPQTRQYLWMLSSLQEDAIVDTSRRDTKDEDEEEFLDR